MPEVMIHYQSWCLGRHDPCSVVYLITYTSCDMKGLHTYVHNDGEFTCLGVTQDNDAPYNS